MVAPERSITLKMRKCNTTFEIEIKMINKQMKIQIYKIIMVYLTKLKKSPILYVRYIGGV